MIGGFIIKKIAEVYLNEKELTPEVEITPVIETEVETLPIIEIEAETLPIGEGEANASSEDCDKYCQDLKILALKLAELEDKFAKLEIKLNNPVEKQKKKVNCKCKGKMVKESKCKCRNKKKAKAEKAKAKAEKVL